MADPVYLRGNTIFFAVSFTDHDGQPTIPSGAELHLIYGRNVALKIDMVDANNDGHFTAEWDSMLSPLGKVSWSILSLGSWHAVAEGQFNLHGNAATKALVEPP